MKSKVRQFHLYGTSTAENTVIGFINKPKEVQNELLTVLEKNPVLAELKVVRDLLKEDAKFWVLEDELHPENATAQALTRLDAFISEVEG